MTTQAKQALPETNRRTRTSVAMVGLAISMGAYTLPLPNQSDGAVAAESTTGEPTTPSVVPSSFETATLSSSPDSLTSEAQTPGIEHTVQEGQTLWDVARFYKVDAAAIAAANNLSTTAVLRVGQVLVIPTDARIAQAIETTDALTITPSYYGPVKGKAAVADSTASSSRPPGAIAANPELKVKQAKVSENLKQKREQLRSQLSTMGGGQNSEITQAAVVPTNREPIGEAPAVPTILSSSPQVNAKVSIPSVIASSKSRVAYNPTEHDQNSRGTPSGLISHRVSLGDTLGTIARTYNVSVSQLLQTNRISDPNVIFVGQVLVIPQATENSTAQSQYRGEYTGAIASVPPAPPAPAPVSSSSPLPNSVTVSSSVGTKVAAASFSGSAQPLTNESSSRLLQYNHVENLKVEIDQLRSRYRPQITRPQAKGSVQTVPAHRTAVTPATSAPVASAPIASTADRVNPEFNADRYSTLRTQLREKLNRVRTGQPAQPDVTSSPVTTAPTSVKPQLVASAPLGSESYDPLVQSKIGQSVSPELPPLGSGNEYLPGAPNRTAAGYIWPTKGVLTSGFGWRWGRMHKGIDIAGPIGTPVTAAADGVVTYAGWNSGGYGYLVEVQHPDGSMTLYGHNSRILVQVGQQVAQGQQISEMGSTGYSTGPHLHFEVHPSGMGAVNPMAYLPRA